ncbi:MAG TPA: response regulator [Rickettsiales bacterium]|nr:response regulator [Rickettsiales bacterium]
MTERQIRPRKRPAEILLVEDDQNDVLLTKKAFEVLEMPYILTVAKDGEQAMQILNQEGIYSMNNPPDLILLDLSLPKMGGMDILKQIKSDRYLRDIPVVILTGSGEEQKISQGYDLQASSYIVKPVDLSRQRIIEDLIRIRLYGS